MKLAPLAFLLALLVSPATAQKEPGSDCGLVAAYSEIAAREVASVADYQKLVADFIEVNGAHVTRRMRLPPSFGIPPTPDNLAELTADVQKIAKARIDAMQCK